MGLPLPWLKDNEISIQKIITESGISIQETQDSLLESHHLHRGISLKADKVFAIPDMW